MSFPALTVEVAFPSNPLGGSYTWTDISNWVRSIDLRRGRQHVLARFEPGRATITLNGRDGRFDPTNPSSPYWPNVDINRRVRITAAGTVIYTGFAESWTPKWIDNMNTDVVMVATDGLRLLNSINMTTSNYAPGFIKASGWASALWRLDDVPGSTQAYNYVTGVHDLSIVGTVINRVPGHSFADATTGMTLTTGSYVSEINTQTSTSFLNFTATQGFAIEAWVKFTSTAANMVICGVPGGGGAMPFLGLIANAGQLGMLFQNSSSAHLTSGTYNDNAWHQVILARDAGGITHRLYVDGHLQLTATATANYDSTVYLGFAISVDHFAQGEIANCYPAGYTGFVGSISDVSTWPGPHGGINANDALAHYQVGYFGYQVQDSGARTNSVLADYSFADRGPLTAGASLVQAPVSSLNNTTVLSYLQSIEKAENGSLFADVNGKVKLLSRYALLGAASLITLGDGSGEIPYKPSPEFALDNIDLYNDSTVSQLGGVIQRATDSTSVTKYGAPSTLIETGLLITTDTEALNRAQWNVGHYAYPLSRMRSLTVDVLGDQPNRFTQLVYRELRDRVTVNRRPYATPGGFPASQFSQDSYIEGMEQAIDLGKQTWTVTLRLSPAEAKSYWLLGNAAAGALDTTTVLAY